MKTGMREMAENRVHGWRIGYEIRTFAGHLPEAMMDTKDDRRGLAEGTGSRLIGWAGSMCLPLHLPLPHPIARVGQSIG
jgi:hypothetical protein